MIQRITSHSKLRIMCLETDELLTAHVAIKKVKL